MLRGRRLATGASRTGPAFLGYLVWPDLLGYLAWLGLVWYFGPKNLVGLAQPVGFLVK